MSKREVIEQAIKEIDELLALRQGFLEAYRDWKDASAEKLKEGLGEEVAEELERVGPREAPTNRQHRVHIFRQRLHAQRKYLQDLLASAEAQA